VSRFNAVLVGCSYSYQSCFATQAPVWDLFSQDQHTGPRVAQRQSHSITGIAKVAPQNTLPLG
jgi:hypothetical protein